MSEAVNTLECALCDDVFTDGAHCHSCNKKLHFHCAQLNEPGYRKVGAKKQQQWRCPACRQTGQTVQIPAHTAIPSPITSPVIGQGNAQLLEEINKSLFMKLAPLAILAGEIRVLRGEFSSMKSSLGAIDERVNIIQDKLDVVTGDIEDGEQWNRMNNLEVKCIPQSKSENLLELISSPGKLI
ncbi:unnamed protein product [Chilo suppressalis]|uniref:PHD-type domain-containing protein n=1 Tax=Chilo suppressalis TaxID=168631 RepID=A0ABN8B3X7_CHISP|nr:unnamed protein product [Chilo suppressalis]